MATFCVHCGSPVAGRYCSRCGARTAGELRALVPWIAAGAMVLVAILALLWPRRSAGDRMEPVQPLAQGSEAPPDLSGMTPRERFDRLYNRVMTAAEAGNTSEVARFAPMAFAAYDQLPEVDADGRYHAALLHLHVAGDIERALRLADSISAGNPTHLFAPLIRAMAARQSGNASLLEEAQRAYLDHWDGEIGLDRPEYRDHRRMLDQFRETARRGPVRP